MVVFCIPKAEARIARITGGFPNPTEALWPASGVNSKRDAQSPCSWTGICPESLLRGWHVPRVPPGLTKVPNYSLSDFFCTVFTTNVKYF